MSVTSLPPRLLAKAGSVHASRLLTSHFVQSQAPARGYRPEKKRQIKEAVVESRKTTARKIYEMLGLDSPYTIPPKYADKKLFPH